MSTPPPAVKRSRSPGRTNSSRRTKRMMRDSLRWGSVDSDDSSVSSSSVLISSDSESDSNDLTKSEIPILRPPEIPEGGPLPDAPSDRISEGMVGASASHEALPLPTFGYFLPDMETAVDVPEELLKETTPRTLAPHGATNVAIFETPFPTPDIVRRFYLQPNPTVAKEISELPIARVIEWRLSNGVRSVKSIKNRWQIDGLIVQSRGENSPTPCTHCSRNCGPFVGCVVATSPRGNVLRHGTCGNCLWATNNKCSLRPPRTTKYTPRDSTTREPSTRKRRDFLGWDKYAAIDEHQSSPEQQTASSEQQKASSEQQKASPEQQRACPEQNASSEQQKTSSEQQKVLSEQQSKVSRWLVDPSQRQNTQNDSSAKVQNSSIRLSTCSQKRGGKLKPSFPLLKSFMKELSTLRDDYATLSDARDALADAYDVVNKRLKELPEPCDDVISESSDGWDDYRCDSK